MKQYPYIGEHSTQPVINLFTRKGCYIRLNPSDSYDGKEYPYDSDTLFGDITKKYLSNTWGAVESKEHAEFIIELAELHGFKLWMPSDGITRASHFIVCDRELMIHTHDCKRIIENYNLKQITIPLPPKDKGWPQVGDEVLTSDELGVIKSTADSKGFYAVLIDGEYSLLHSTEFEKPKSKQDLLIEELQTKLCNNNAVDNYILACDIINGEIEGLSYEL